MIQELWIPLDELGELKEKIKQNNNWNIPEDMVILIDAIEKKAMNLLKITENNTNRHYTVIKDSSVKLLSPNEFLAKTKKGGKNTWLTKEILMTMRSIGVFEYESIIDLDNESLDEHSHRNYEKNYKVWLWRKLFLTQDEIEQKSVEDINNIASKYLSAWSNHMINFISQLKKENQLWLKSQYFDRITNIWENWDVFTLLKFSLDLEKAKRDEEKEVEKIQSYVVQLNTNINTNIQLIEKNDIDSMEKDRLSRENIELEKLLENQNQLLEKWKRSIKQRVMWQYEIQRLLWLAMQYMDREKNHLHQHAEEDNAYLTKLLQWMIQQDDSLLVNLDQQSSDPLYGFTESKTMYYTRLEDWVYQAKEPKDIKTDDNKEHIPFHVNSAILRWKTRHYSKNQQEFNLVHVATRWEKWAESAINKLVRKNHITFDEIHDHKWYKFVLENLDQAENLLKVIENELWTLRTSWIKWPTRNRDNTNSSENYDSYQWTIKVPYKWERLREFYEELDKMVTWNKKIKLKLKRLQAEFSLKYEAIQSDEQWNYSESSKISLSEIDNQFLKAVTNIFSTIDNEYVRKNFSKYKERFKKKQYNIELEIQIFDVNWYLKSEIDEKSPAYHKYYKKKQTLTMIPKLFPIEIYWEQVENVYNDEIKTHKNFIEWLSK